MATNFVFLNVDDPELFKQGENKTLVQSHVGKYNRSRAKTYRPVEKFQRIGKFAAIRARKSKGEKIEVTADDERVPPMLTDPKLLPSSDDARRNDLKSCAMGESSSSMKDIIHILPVSQQMNYGSSPTLPSSTSDSHIDDVNENETCDEKELLKHWTAFLLFRLPGQGRRNPFARWPVEVDESKTQISQLIDHATTGFWSVLTPHEEFGPRNPSNHVYLEHMHHSVLAFYCYTIAISHNFDFLSDLPPLSKQYRNLRAKYLHAATTLVRKHIESLPANPKPEQISDELIGSVIALAANYKITVDSRESRLKSKFKSPLATLQCLDMWGLEPLLPPHRRAVIQLTNLKGGLREIQSSDLAGVVQLTDLMDASRRLSSPMLPWDDTGGTLPPPSWPLESIDSSNLAKAFELLPASVLDVKDLCTTISATAHTIHHLTQYFMTGCPQATMRVLCHSRNRSQHMTLSLPNMLVDLFESRACIKQSQESLSNIERHIYEIVRLTLLTFNNLVIYPLPPNVVDTMLSRILREELRTATMSEPDLKHQHAELLFWSLILGGISDHYDVHRSWYVDEARDILNTMPHLRRWINMEKLLTSFLWSDFILNEEAMKFWLEASYTPNIQPGEIIEGCR